MFQWFTGGNTCLRSFGFDEAVRLSLFKCILLVFLFLQSPGMAYAGSSPPTWNVPARLTSDDGYASLSWAPADGETPEFFKITETFRGKDSIHYTEATGLMAWRVEPGEYDLVLQSCVRDVAGVADCGSSSGTLTLEVTEAVTSILLANADTKSMQAVANAGASAGANGGPGQLQPGHWYNPAKDGHGWSFYWSNRLALSQGDPLFGNNYDLVGIWYTYEAKFSSIKSGCWSCTPVPGAYRPVVLKLKAITTGSDTYGGSLYVSRNDGSEVWVGSADIAFGADNSNATINWNASFKKERLSDSDPLEFLHGSDPADTSDISHFSGHWRQSDDDRFYVVTNIGDTAEVVTVVFHDDAGDPTWIQAVDQGVAVPGSTSFCLAYQKEGYSPQTEVPLSWAQSWYMSGCDPALSVNTSNRNGRRYFSDLDKQYFWADFTLPGTSVASGSISIGSSHSVVALEKSASFHGVSYDSATGSSCELTANSTACNVQLTWFTDGNYPQATVYAHNLSSNTYDKVQTSSQPVMADIPYQLSTPGQYEFELHMGNGAQTTLMAKSASFTVTQQSMGSSPEKPPVPVYPRKINPSASSSKVGATMGEFRVVESGSATYSIPILTAPASGGVKPQISLNYNSQAGNGDVGVGWALGGVSAVALCPQTMEQDGISGSRGIKLDGEDRFCLDGQRLVVDPSTGSYGEDGTRYRTEIDSFSRITAYGSAGNGPAWFRVEHKDGSVAEYGNSGDSRIEARGSENPATVFVWAQNRFEDRSDNYILYSYLESNSGPVAYVLQAIDYTGNKRAGTSPSARLSFAYSDRDTNSDLTYSYFAGVKVEQRHLLQSIRSQGRLDAGSPLEDLRFYELAYEEDGVGRKIMTELTECRSVSRAICYKPTRFEWLKSESTIDKSAILLSGLLPKKTLSGLLLADVSGDGRPDLLYSNIKNQRHDLYVKEATANTGFSEWSKSFSLTKNADGQSPRLYAIDINADGFQDVAYAKYSKTTGDYTWVVLVSTGSSFSAEAYLNPNHRFFLNDEGLESRIQVMDFNGDGQSDILHAHTDKSGTVWQLTVLLNRTTAGGNPVLSAPIGLDVKNTDLFPNDISGNWDNINTPAFFKWTVHHPDKKETPEARVFDFNGDGAVDLLLKVWRRYQKCILNCGQESFGSGGNGINNNDPVFDVTYASFWVLMESNGQNAFTRNSVVAKGLDCAMAAICGAPEYEGLSRTDNLWPVDINADGLADLAWGDAYNNWYFQLNTGAGFESARLIGQVSDDVNKLVKFEDWNGDTYPDLIYPSLKLDANAKWMVYQNHFGRIFAAVIKTKIPAGNVGGNVDADPVENDSSMFADFNGDGKTDQLLIDSNNDGEILSTSLRKGMNASGSRAVEAANVITSITNGFGAKTEVFYRPLTDKYVYSRMRDSVNADWGNGSAVYDFISPIYVVSEVNSSAPVYSNPSATSRVQYHYVGAKLQAGGRGFLGFGEVISYDPQSNIRTNTRYRQDFPFIGMLADTTRVSSAAGSKFGLVSNTATKVPVDWGTVSQSGSFPPGKPLSYTLNQWKSKSATDDAIFPYVSGSVARSYTLEGKFSRKEIAKNNYDRFGNLTSSSVSTYATDGGAVFARQSMASTYINDASNWILGRQLTSRVTFSRANQPSITRNSQFTYDLTTGHLKQEVAEPNSKVFRVTTDYKLDDFGNRKQTTVTGINMSARKTTLRYDSLGRFVTESLNALNQTTQSVKSWDVFGNPLDTEDIGGVLTTGVTDHMGKTFASFSETGSWTKITHSSSSGSKCPVDTAYWATSTAGGAPTQIHCYDLLGRSSRVAVKGLDGSYIYTDKYYDSSGRVARVSEPYFAGDPRYWNITAFDDLGRITDVLSAGGDDITTDYDNRAANRCVASGAGVTVTINGLKQQRVEVKNAKDETEAVYDHNCGLVSYDYDAVGNLKEVAGVDSQKVKMTYDIAGRKIAMNDPDKGYWQYSYNSLGEMRRQLDSKNQAIDFTYDALGRVVNRRELKDVSSLQDTAFTTVNREKTSYHANGSAKGKVASVTYRIGEDGEVLHQKEFTYDRFGRIDMVSTWVGREQFVKQTTYDQYSRVFQQFDESGDDRGLRYIYSNGYISKLREAREGLSGLVYQEIQAMDAHGNVTIMHLGNGIDVLADYEPDSGRLTNLSAFDASGVEVMEVGYLFNVLGSLKKRHDLSAGADLRERFEYDDLNRLKTVDLSVAGGGSERTLSLNYDPSGNITYKSDVGTYLYSGTQPHAVTRAGGNNYNYDANGNQISGGGRTTTYTVFDKPDSIAKGASHTDFSYGVGNSRYQREDYENGVLQKNTLYLGGVERITKNGSAFFKRYLGGVAVATYYPSTGIQQLSYLLKDHIGSIHSVLNASGLITASMHFSAFGERKGADWQTPLTSFLYAPLNDTTTRGFTGHEHVDSLGIIHMNGRIYDPKLGRFLQADSIVQAPTNSQSLNRFSYVLNNPLSYTDPSGYFSLKKFIKNWGPVIVGAIASYFTYGAASGWAFGLMSSTAAGVATSAAYTGSAVIGGAAAGFVGGAIVSGSFKGAVKGALIGALFAYVGDRIAAGISNWRQGQGSVWRVKYDELNGVFTKEYITDTSIIQVDDLFVNGQAGTLEKSIDLGIQQLGQPKEFFLFHNPTHGFIADTIESALGKLTDTSGLSRQLAGILEQQSQSITILTAHSQGGIIVSNALRQVVPNSLTANTVINFNGAGVSPKIFSQTVARAGATQGVYQAHFFDAVPNILGQGTFNPLRILGSFLASPLLFAGPALSPHTIYLP